MKRWKASVLAASLVYALLCAPACALTLTGVHEGDTISGALTFAATQCPTGTASVEFDIDGLRASPVIVAAPYTLQWDSSTQVYDGR